MRVLLGSFPAVTVLGGGVLVQVRSLAEELGNLGVEAELFDPWKPYRLSDYDLFHLFGAHVGTYHLGRAVATLGMKLVLSPVFYSRHPAQRVRSMVAVAGRLRKRGGVWTEHMFCKELCDMATLVMPNTSEEADMVRQAFGVGAERVKILPNGVSARFAEAVPDEFVTRYGLRDFLLYVGHIGWGRKNVLPMLRAVERIGCRTVLIGEMLNNDYGRQCRTIIERNESIIHIPPLEPNSPLLASAYAACDTLVLPSFYETPGLAALEAGLAGAKVCITRYGGTRDYFAELATYLDPRSEESIRNAVSASLARPKDPVLRNRIRERYLWGTAAGVLHQAYLQVSANAHTSDRR
ncbi:MAG TPA: glycosyltransferase [candidate division WOR-3 bacterium]|uniref:Glycosyltransferase n=1 Tax=candidate division WOR-3 bacterium TaxID=2052148 RepID=A0A7V0T5I1_UNCW3|nr:glycosyltransferase [candidate division WOR-3 bacterium]